MHKHHFQHHRCFSTHNSLKCITLLHHPTFCSNCQSPFQYCSDLPQQYLGIYANVLALSVNSVNRTNHVISVNDVLSSATSIPDGILALVGEIFRSQSDGLSRSPPVSPHFLSLFPLSLLGRGYQDPTICATLLGLNLVFFPLKSHLIKPANKLSLDNFGSFEFLTTKRLFPLQGIFKTHQQVFFSHLKILVFFNK